MKNVIIKLVVCFLGAFVFLLNVFSQSIYHNSSIIGTWIAENDSNWKVTFTNDRKCYQYYQGSISEVDSFVVSNTSPQCGQVVPVDNYTSYLKLINISTKEASCYEINGITNTTLSIRPIDKGEVIVFIRQ